MFCIIGGQFLLKGRLMRKFLLVFLIFIIAAFVVLVLVNSIMANIHNVSMLEEVKDWGAAISSCFKKFTLLFKGK